MVCSGLMMPLSLIRILSIFPCIVKGRDDSTPNAVLVIKDMKVIAHKDEIVLNLAEPMKDVVKFHNADPRPLYLTPCKGALYFPASNDDGLENTSNPGPYVSITGHVASVLSNKQEFGHADIDNLNSLISAGEYREVDSRWSHKPSTSIPLPPETLKIARTFKRDVSILKQKTNLAVVQGKGHLQGIKSSSVYAGIVSSKSSPSCVSVLARLHFSFTLSDDTGSITVNCWGKKVLEYFENVKMGGILFIYNSRLKRIGGSKRAVVTYNTPNEYDISNFELVVENSDRGNDYETRIRFGLFETRFHLFHQGVPLFSEVLEFQNLQSACMRMLKYREEQRFILAGILTYVGRREILRVTRPNNLSQLYEYRWIRLKTSSDSGEIVVQLFSNGQMNSFMRLIPGTFFVCTDCALSFQVTSSLTPLSICARTTKSSSYFATMSNIETSMPEIIETLRQKFSQGHFEDVKHPPKISYIPAFNPLTNPIKKVKRTRQLHSLNDSSFVEFLRKLNPSSELVQDTLIASSLTMNCTMTALASRFPPFSKMDSLADFISKFEDIHLGETISFRVLAQVKKCVLYSTGSMPYKCACELVEQNNSKIRLSATMERDSRLGPIHPLSYHSSKENSKLYFERMFGMALTDLRKSGPQLLWLTAHRSSYKSVEVECRGVLDSRWE